MENKNIVAIVGRTNVGKSCLFNRLVGRRQAIVEATSGVTRDRVYAQVDWGRKVFKLVDTGGMLLNSKVEISSAIFDQVQKAVAEATLILLVLDSKTGLTAQDEQIMEFLRNFSKKIILVVNKVDDLTKFKPAGEFYELGIEPVHLISALHGLNIDQLLDSIVEELKPEDRSFSENEAALKIAIVGRPNVGKSLFLNKILKEERVIVDNCPGTTRDAIDTYLFYNDQRLILIDTAGIRQKKKPHSNIDIYSRTRTIQAIKRADVCIVIVDAQSGILRDDLHIFSLVKDAGKCAVIVVNKCDIIKLKVEDCIHTISQKASFMSFAFCVLCSAKLSKNLNFALNFALYAWENNNRKIKQKKLNQTLAEIQSHLNPVSRRGQLKIHYFTQPKSRPPTFVLIVNNTGFIKKSFLRYVENELRRRYDFKGSSIKLVLKKKTRKK